MRKGLVMLGLLTTACVGGDAYDLAAISNGHVTTAADGSRTLSFQVRQDSLYFCPGVRRQKKDGADYFTVVRCTVGKTCTVDLKAEAAATGEAHTVVLPADTASMVYVVGRDGSQEAPNR